jgi:hypothetical protein
MAKGKGDETMKRFWIRGTDATRKALAHLAIDLDTSAEKLAGYILADAVAKAGGNADALRKVMPRNEAK